MNFHDVVTKISAQFVCCPKQGVLEIEEVPKKERKKQEVWQCSCRNCWGEKREKKLKQ